MKNTVLFLFVVVYFSRDNFIKAKYSNTWVVKGVINTTEIGIIAAKFGFKVIDKLYNGQFLLQREDVSRYSKRKSDIHTKRLAGHRKITYVKQEQWLNVSLRQAGGTFAVQDPMWSQSWYLNEASGQSMGILGAWRTNYTGKGVVIGIVDDGVDYRHPDLINKIDRRYSTDVYDNDNDPTPAIGMSHGTNCAGIATAEKNQICVIGSAYNAKLVAVRMIGPFGVLPSGQIRALKNPNIHISSNSWGGSDGTFDGPKPEVENALRTGVTSLRGGKGVIYLFAAGNGGYDDNCNTDGYVNSIYTISINGVTRSHEPPGYAEPCTAVLASAYTGAGGNTDNLCTTHVNNGCVRNFTGTSGATPLAAGTLGLVLEANPKLHWRDMQELIVRTSKLDKLKYAQPTVNGAGRNVFVPLQVSDWFGYGLLDAQALIKEALAWQSLPEQHTCTVPYKTEEKSINPKDSVRIIQSVITTDGCNDTENCVNSIEHVEARVVFSYTYRGVVELTLQSPAGTISTLLTARNPDSDANSQLDWKFMSVQFWGEQPIGTWKLKFSVSAQINEGGTLKGWSLNLYGTGVGCSRNKTTTTITPTVPTTPVPPTSVIVAATISSIVVPSTTTKAPPTSVIVSATLSSIAGKLSEASTQTSYRHTKLNVGVSLLSSGTLLTTSMRSTDGYFVDQTPYALYIGIGACCIGGTMVIAVLISVAYKSRCCSKGSRRQVTDRGISNKHHRNQVTDREISNKDQRSRVSDREISHRDRRIAI